MGSLSEQIAELAELRHRATLVCNETCRLIREFQWVRVTVRAEKAIGAAFRGEMSTRVRQRERADAG